MRHGEPVFVDSGAWIALALTRDPLHERAVEAWTDITKHRAQVHAFGPVILETFTFGDRKANRSVAIFWKNALNGVMGLRVLARTERGLPEAWKHDGLRNPHKLSAVDASTFVLMHSRGIRSAFAFDHHFASAGFRLVG